MSVQESFRPNESKSLKFSPALLAARGFAIRRFAFSRPCRLARALYSHKARARTLFKRYISTLLLKRNRKRPGFLFTQTRGKIWENSKVLV